ncbi:protein vein isoform X2 [Eurosta solidaginis]|uniref:protein vein isoform X2 n=1 Tax=Eurosta solidaginis TaxID=178769 RepID=UPI003530ABEF
MYARVLRKWSLQTKLQMFNMMWRLLLLLIFLLLLCLCATPATCIAVAATTTANTINMRAHVSRRAADAHASAFVLPENVISQVTAKAPNTIIPFSLPLIQKTGVSHPTTTVKAATVGDIIEESYYIPVDGGNVVTTDSNIYENRLVRALDIANVFDKQQKRAGSKFQESDIVDNNKNSWRNSNSFNSGSSSLFSSSSLVSNIHNNNNRNNNINFKNSNNNENNSSGTKSALQNQFDVKQQQRDKSALATYADNLAYAYHRRKTLPATSNSLTPAIAQTNAVAATATTTALKTVYTDKFSVQHVANDENVADDDDDDIDGAEEDVEEEAFDGGASEEEEDDVVNDDVDVADADADDADVDGHTTFGDNDDDGRQQQKVPNKNNSHIINLLKAYRHSKNHYNNNQHNKITLPKLQEQQLQNRNYLLAQPQQQQTAQLVRNSAMQLHSAARRSYKARRHVNAEQQTSWYTQQQQKQILHAHHGARNSQHIDTNAPHITPSVEHASIRALHAITHSAQHTSSTSTPLPIEKYPTKKVYQLVNGKNLTRIVHLLPPPTHYRIAAYEIPSSLPYRGELTEQQRHMLQHQREQQQLQLQMQQDQAARSRRDSRLFGLTQSMSAGGSGNYYSMQAQPVLGQQFQRLQQQSNSGSNNNWQQMSAQTVQRQTYQQQRQQQQQYQLRNQYSNNDYSNNYRNAHNHNHQHNHNYNNKNHHNHNKHYQRQRQRKRTRRYCSARDPAQLAFEAPIVFEGKITSMSPDRRHNFAATVQVLNAYKQQIGYQVKREQFVRLQFAYINSSGECDIYREQLRPRGLVRGDELELQRTYLFFVQQIDMRNFTILGQPIRKTRRVVEAVKDAVSEDYAQLASIRTITTNRTMEIGKELHIVCKVQGRPPPKVTWFKDGKSINRNRKLYKFRHFKKRSELIIRSFNISDTGRYECRAKNKINQEPDRRTILIKADPEPRYPTSLMGGTGNVCPDDAAEFCLNGGTCNFFSEIGSYSCICPEGFMGERCDRKEVNNISPKCIVSNCVVNLKIQQKKGWYVTN